MSWYFKCVEDDAFELTYSVGGFAALVTALEVLEVCPEPLLGDVDDEVLIDAEACSRVARRALALTEAEVAGVGAEAERQLAAMEAKYRLAHDPQRWDWMALLRDFGEFAEECSANGGFYACP